jgi:hypothetical protein
MIIRNDTGTIVIAGGWNKEIFNKDWVGKYLLPGEDLLVEVNFIFPGSHRISGRNVRIEVFNNRLIFVPISNKIESYELIEELASKTADYLPHTPVNGCGINFIYESQSEIFPGVLAREFNIKDGETLISMSKINYTLIYNLGSKELNINLIKEDADKFVINFNYHYNLRLLTDFKGLIHEDSVNKLRIYSEKVINDLFGFDINKA